MIRKTIKISFITGLALLIFSSAAFSAGKKVTTRPDSEKKITAVLPFTTRNCKEAYSDIVREIIEIEFHKSEAFVIIERSRMDLLLKEQSLKESGCADTSCAVEIGKLLSADYILLGTLSKISNYTITVKLVDTSKGNIVLADSEKAESEEKIEEAAKILANRIAGNKPSVSPAINNFNSQNSMNNSNADREEFSGSMSRSFNVAPGGLLTLNTDLGNVIITGSSGNTIEIKVTGKVKDLTVEFEKRGNNVFVTGKHTKWPFRFFWFINNVRFDISVPEKYDLNINTKGGRIETYKIEGSINTITSGGSLKYREIKGPVTGTTSGGSIELEECAGRVLVRTSGGGIKIRNLDGELNAHTSGGSLNFDNVKGNISAGTSGGFIHLYDINGTVNVNTTGGSIDLYSIKGSINATTSGGGISAELLNQPDSSCSLTTSAGSITLKLISNVSADIDASTTAGKVYCDFPVNGMMSGEIKNSHLKGKINRGGPMVYLRTSAGSVNIKKIN